MMLRFWLRSTLLLFLPLVFLTGVVLLASGALRPVRYFVAETRGDLVLVSDSGDTVQVTLPGENFRAVRTGESQVAWFNDDAEVVVWSNGQRQQIGRYLLNNSVLRAGASPGNYVAWQPELTQTSQLRVWDGETVSDVPTGPGAVALWNWIDQSGLLWLQAAESNQWHLMHWDGQETRQIHTTQQQVTAFNFLPCGAVHLDLVDRQWIYNAGTMTPLPNALIPFAQLRSDNCQTFLFDDVGFNFDDMQDYLWNGAGPVHLPFQAAALKGDDTLIGLQPVPLDPESANQLTMVYQQDGEMHTHTWEAPLSIIGAALLFWDDPFVFWEVSQSNGTFILQWNRQTDDVSVFETSSRLTGVYTHAEADQRAAWLHFREPSVLHLHTWQNQHLSEHHLTFATTPTGVQESDLRWMNDGSLLIMLRHTAVSTTANGPVETTLYRWDGTTLEPITGFPFDVRLISDWMVWE